MHSFKRSIKAPKPCSSTCSLQKIARKVYYYMNDAHILSSSVITKLLFTISINAQADLHLCCTNIPMSLHG